METIAIVRPPTFESHNGGQTQALHAFTVHFQRRGVLRELPVDDQWQPESYRGLQRNTERVSGGHGIDGMLLSRKLPEGMFGGAGEPLER